MVESYEKEIREYRHHATEPQPYKVNIVGNKSDKIQHRQVSKDEGEKLATKYGWTFCEASAAENTGISEAFFGLSGFHGNSVAELLGSSSDSDSASPSEKQSKKKTRRRCARHRSTKFGNFNIFRWHSQP